MNLSNPKSDFVDGNGIRLHYLDWGGNGPMLIFLTGMGAGRSEWTVLSSDCRDKRSLSCD